ncbi:MAG: oligosaccharide flippase family protein [Nitrospirae bacterium]|nr:oligosaccharide flippase family protein [Nitrospirota bacterium]
MIKAVLNRFKGSQMARNTSWMLFGNGIKTVVQAAYFVLIARSLHSDGYGAFVGVCALVAIAFPFASLGFGNILIRNVARNASSFGRYWGNTLLMTLISGGVLLLLVLAVARFVLPASIPFSLIFIIAVTSLFFDTVHVIGAQAFQAVQRLHRTALLNVIPNIFRLIAIAGLSALVKSPSPLQWSCLYLATGLICALIAGYLVNKELGPPVFTLKGMKADILEGFYFSITLSSQNIYNDIDKSMLTRLSSLSAVGIYAAAYRIIDVSFTPVRSLLAAVYAKFFQHGESGVRGSLRFAIKLIPFAGGYGFVAGIVLVLAAPLLPYVLGAEYADAADALRWLSPLPFLKAVHFFAADTLTSAGYQGLRSGVQVFVAVFNAGINLWLIPAYSWRGAAWSSIASDGLLAVLLWAVLLHISNKTNRLKMPRG